MRAIWCSLSTKCNSITFDGGTTFVVVTRVFDLYSYPNLYIKFVEQERHHYKTTAPSSASFKYHFSQKLKTLSFELSGRLGTVLNSFWA